MAADLYDINRQYQSTTPALKADHLDAASCSQSSNYR